MDLNIFCLLIWIIFPSQCLTKCPTERIDEFKWKTTSQRHEKTSKPMCLDQNHLPVTRKCVNETWTPSLNKIKCQSKQNDNWSDTFCLENYSRVPNTRLCILISEEQKWSDLCLLSTEANPAHTQYKEVREILDKGNNPYWLPIRRDHRLSDVRYKTIKHYNLKFNESLIAEPFDGDCLMYSKQKYYLSNCDNLYRTVCLIDIDEVFEFSQYNCKENSYTTFNPRYHGNCYRILPFNNNNQPLRHPLIINSAEIQYLANAFVKNISIEHVQVDIMPVYLKNDKISSARNFNVTYWEKGNVTFTNWNSNFRRSLLNLEPYTTIKNGKWHLVSNNKSIQYTIYVEPSNLTPDPGFEFEFDNVTGRLTIADNSQNYFMHFCYLNNHRAIARSRLGRQYFRCERFTMKTLKLLKSPTIEVWKKETLLYEIFVIILDKKCTKCDFIHESRSIEDDITSLTMENQIIQFRKIIDIDIKMKTTTFSLHVLVKKSLLKSLYQKLSNQLQDWPYNVKDLRHIDTCLGKSGNYFHFPDVLIGETSTNENCHYDNGDHPTLKCIGDSDVGAYWKDEVNYKLLQEVNRNMSKLDSNPISAIDILASITQCQNTIDTFEDNNNIIYQLIDKSVSTKLFELDADKPPEERPFAKLANTFDNVLETGYYSVQDSQKAENASSAYLTNYRRMIESYLKSNAAALNLNSSEDGTYLIQDNNTILLVIDPFRSINPVTGMSIYKKRLRRKEKNFLEFTIKKTDHKSTTSNIIDRRLEAGIYILNTTISQLMEKTSNYKKFRIVLSIFYRDYLFKENSRTKDLFEPKSKIIGVFIPEYPNEELPDGISTIFKTTRNRKHTKRDGCSNWQTGTNQSGWNRNFYSYTRLDRNIINCPIKQTSFSGYVQLIGNDKLIDCNIESHAYIINWITIIMSTLSVIGVILIFIAALKIKVFRSNETTPLILIQALAVALQIIVYLVFVELKLFNADDNEMIEVVCLATGATLHYLTLVGFFISLFATDHLIRAYVIGSCQLITASFNKKIIVFGWMLPIVIVSVCVFIDKFFDTELYLPIDIFNDHSSICYPVEELLLVSIHIPIGIIVTLHLVIFVWTIIKTNRTHESVITKVSHVKDKCLTYVYVFSILLINWLFAVIVYYVEDCWVHMIFSYLFTITAPSQGFLIFVVCVVFNGNVQFYFKRMKHNRQFK